MTERNSRIDELLCGLLDGQLNEVERAEIELLLQLDPVLLSDFKSLKRNRDLLSKLPNVKANPLAAQVIRESIARAVEMGAEAPTWIPKSELLVRDTTEHAEIWQNESPERASTSDKRRISRLALAIAASFVIVVCSYAVLHSLSTSALKDAPVQLAQGLDVPSTAGSEKSEDIVASLPEKSISSDVPLNREGQRQQATDDMSKDPLATLATDEPTHDGSSDNLLPEALSGNNIFKQMPTVESTVGVNSRYKADLALGDDLSSSFLLLVDLTASSQIDSTEALNRILRQHDIAAAEELDATQSTIEALKKSRLVAAQKAVDALTIDLIFVKARATRLDAAILTVMGDAEAFPEFALDLAMDPPSLELFRELRFVQEADLTAAESASTTVSVASRLRFGASDSHFDFASRSQPVMPLETRNASREHSNRSLLSGEEGNPVAHALFILRRAGNSE